MFFVPGLFFGVASGLYFSYRYSPENFLWKKFFLWILGNTLSFMGVGLITPLLIISIAVALLIDSFDYLIILVGGAMGSLFVVLLFSHIWSKMRLSSIIFIITLGLFGGLGFFIDGTILSHGGMMAAPTLESVWLFVLWQMFVAAGLGAAIDKTEVIDSGNKER